MVLVVKVVQIELFKNLIQVFPLHSLASDVNKPKEAYLSFFIQRHKLSFCKSHDAIYAFE